MPIRVLLQGAAFDAATVKIITSAFDAALEDLELDRIDPDAELVARKIIECASMGEHDPVRLCALGVAAVGGHDKGSAR
jgi:hypothetical protein